MNIPDCKVVVQGKKNQKLFQTVFFRWGGKWSGCKINKISSPGGFRYYCIVDAEIRRSGESYYGFYKAPLPEILFDDFLKLTESEKEEEKKLRDGHYWAYVGTSEGDISLEVAKRIIVGTRYKDLNERVYIAVDPSYEKEYFSDDGSYYPVHEWPYAFACEKKKSDCISTLTHDQILDNYWFLWEGTWFKMCAYNSKIKSYMGHEGQWYTVEELHKLEYSPAKPGE